MEGAEDVLPLHQGGLRVLADAQLGADADEQLDEEANQVLVHRHHQHKGHGDQVVGVAHNQDPDAGAGLHGNVVPVGNPQHGGKHRQHKLEAEELHRQGGGANADGHPLLLQVIDLHGLTAGGTRGHIGVVHANNGVEQGIAEGHLIALTAEIVPDGERIQTQMQQIGTHTKDNPHRRNRLEGIHCPGHFLPVNTDQQHKCQGAEDQYEIQNLLRPGLHKPSLLLHNHSTV